MPTLRESRGQRYIRTVGRIVAVVRCLNCDHDFTVDRDEDGDAAIEQQPCHGSDTCTAMLCSECAVACACCGLATCADHLAEVDGDKACAVCCGEEAKCHAA